MHTGIKLSHDEMVVLAAIADQKLTSTEICEELMKNLQRLDTFLDEPLCLSLNDMKERGLLTKTRSFFASYYAIAPEVLSLNHPPYSYESWRDLSD